MSVGRFWKTAAEMLARTRPRERIALGLTAGVMLLAFPSGCTELIHGHYATGLFLLGAPLLPIARSSQMVHDALHRPTPG